MIVIASVREDKSTREVIDWLDYHGKDYFFLDIYKVVHENLNLQIGNNNINDVNVNPEDIKAFWYRRHHSIVFDENNATEESAIKHKISLSKHLHAEAYIVYQYLFKKFAKGNILSDFNKRTINKLITLESAHDIGILIPNTLLTRSKKELINFKAQQKSIITKAISEIHSFKTSDRRQNITSYTQTVSDETIKQLPDYFFPSLFQTQIEKDVEIRSFYLDGKFYSMAIFSQLDQQTSTDFRVYNYKKPNRKIPFKLPDTLESKLEKLMASLDLNTGSIDLIKSKTGEFYLLEVNPVGQFGMTSGPCNYYLEEKVAKFLSK